MEDAGNVIGADIKGDKAYIEYGNSEDMRYAIKKITATELTTAQVCILEYATGTRFLFLTCVVCIIT